MASIRSWCRECVIITPVRRVILSPRYDKTQANKLEHSVFRWVKMDARIDYVHYHLASMAKNMWNDHIARKLGNSKVSERIGKMVCPNHIWSFRGRQGPMPWRERDMYICCLHGAPHVTYKIWNIESLLGQGQISDDYQRVISWKGSWYKLARKLGGLQATLAFWRKGHNEHGHEQSKQRKSSRTLRYNCQQQKKTWSTCHEKFGCLLAVIIFHSKYIKSCHNTLTWDVLFQGAELLAKLSWKCYSAEFIDIRRSKDPPNRIYK